MAMLRYGTFVTLTLLLVSACTNPQEDGVPAAEQEVVWQPEDFRRDAAQMLSVVSAELRQLEAQLEQAGENARDRMSTSVADLREEHESLQERLQDLQSLPASDYHDQREDIHQRIDELRADVQRVQLETAPSQTAFRKRAEHTLTRIDSTFQEVEERFDQAEQPIQAQRKGILEDLRTRRNELAQRIENIESASDEAFQQVRSEVTTELADLYAEQLQALRAVERVLRRINLEDESNEAAAE